MSYAEGESNPYSQKSSNLTPQTPSLADVIERALRELSVGMRVAMPCVVHEVKGNQLADIQPLLKSRYVDGTVDKLPIIANALVAMPMGQGTGGSWGIRLPLAKGDVGLAVFVDRSLDVYALSQGDTPVDPQDCRAHDLTDAVFFPGLCTVPSQTTDTTKDLTLSNGSAVARLQKPGTFVFSNGQHEFVDLACQLAQSLQNLCDLLSSQAFVNTLMGPQPFIASTVQALIAQKQAAATLLAHLQTLRGQQ